MPRVLGLVLSLSLAAAPAAAVTLSDPAGDFIPTYTGPAAGDLDVLSVTATYGSLGVILSATVNGPVGTTPGAPYVWGVDRGQGTARFGAVADQVLFDAVVIAFANGVGNVTLLVPTPVVAFALPAGSVTVDGNRITVRVPSGLLPSTGFAFGDYGYNLWPRAPGIGGIPGISDFAPDNAVFRATFVPEPGIWAMLVSGFGVLGIVSRRRRVPA